MQPQPYARLDPDAILSALEAVDLLPTGGLLALNSYENRVYQVAMEDRTLGEFLIAKFYRPERWTDAAILEEHAFTRELADEELSVVVPIELDGRTLFEHGGYRFALFRRQGGHPPNIENQDDLEVLARTLGRMHAVGARQPFAHRRALTVAGFGEASRAFVLASSFLPPEVRDAYETTTAHLLERIGPLSDGVPAQRIHGDSHLGNILWRDDTPHFVDFDDCMMGPPIQDLWMLLSGDRADQTGQLATILDAYQDFYDFDVSTLRLVEPLRSLRIMHHAAWIGQRWEDPAFPPAFPGFDQPRYWSEHLLALREQLALLDEPPLVYL